MRLYFAGGLNEQETPHIFECGSGWNFELGLKQSKLIPRAPFDKKGTATNGLPINGFVQLVKRDKSETTLVQAGDALYLWDGASSFTSKATVDQNSRLRDVYWSLGDYSLIVDTAKLTPLRKWDGSNVTSAVTGLGSLLYAKYAVVHLNRVWLFNVKTSSDTPHLMVASAFEDPTSYDTSKRAGPTTSGGGSFSTGLEAFYMLTPDLKPINGVALFYGNLIISTEGGKLYKLSGTTAATFAWTDYYAGSCAVGTESMANIGNDVIYMKSGGGIDLLSSTQESGDVAADDVSRFIPTTTKDLTSATTIYDQKNQKVLFFVSNKVLALFKDLMGGELSPWSVYKTAHSSAFNTNAAKYMKMPGTQTYSVYWGDSAGNIYDLNGTGASGDAGANTISVYRKNRYITEGEGGDKSGKGALDLYRHILNGEVTYRRIYGSCDVTLSFDWGNEYNVSQSTITLKGAPSSEAGVYYGGGSYYSGTAYFSQGSAYAQKTSSQSFSPTGKGPGFFLSVNLDTSTAFRIDHIDLY